MAKRLQLGSKKGLFLSLDISSSKRRDHGLLWGKGVLSVDGVPIISSDDNKPVEWTWVDLLEWLARNWASLLLEQGFPFHVSSLHIGYVFSDLEKRWDNMSEWRVEEEEEEALRFLSRHDFASAFKGIYFPSAYFMRHGNLVEIVSAESFDIKCLTLNQAVEDLEEIGNALAERVRSFAGAVEEGSRGLLAVSNWDSRGVNLQKYALTKLTGMSAESLDAFSVANDNDFWEYDTSQPLVDTELMAAARMTGGSISLQDKKELLEKIRKVDKRSTRYLDKLTDSIVEEFKEIGKPHDQGYWAANWLRKKLKKDESSAVKPKEILEKWDVLVQEISLPGAQFDALACWGPRHGPAILINQSSESVPSHAHRENSTLAHEICHLLLDRNGALPVVEVLNGNTPERLEKRARAFAAELMLPREIASNQVRNSTSLEKAITTLSQEYEVSESLVCWQIINSPGYDSLSEHEQSFLQSKNKQ
ncbi:ImmA/IrrE family metallo-endopeptidase [Vreelandella titanicae]|uniref:ImmA/IrrE family metallo-endopeptidase n=1 Tax=Vreelandella titanicae TaxID=664683 RepID=UPI001681BC8E|nr:ImmA/IrrE family metallo-endopeptidase [Halomonas titanicae]QNU62091.1 ImmA/IrrE family metallo-endopeptidase [Halomonas titanicae]